MKIFDIYDSAGQLCGFEVSNTLLSRRRACAIAARVPGVRVLRRPSRFSWSREEVFCEFELEGTRFEIAEPFGDNSRYWVGPADASPVPELAAVRAAFARATLLPALTRAAAR